MLSAFRRTPVLVPLDTRDCLWSAAYRGVRWLYAFSDEAALARFIRARGDENDREWAYQRVLGARLLDVFVPRTGTPTGVALDVGSTDVRLLPPLSGIVPDAVAVDAVPETGGREAMEGRGATDGAR